MNYILLVILFTIARNSLAQIKPVTGESICYDDFKDLGCFNTSGPFKNFSLYKESDPKSIGLEFLLYNNDLTQPKTLTYNDENSLKSSGFKTDKGYKLKIIVHGYGNDKNTQWLTDMKNEFLKAEKNNNEKYNVIIVIWGPGAILKNYKYAAANTRIVGKALEILVEKIKNVLYSSAPRNLNIHCIGHDLGAHICSYASDRYKILFDRITGLDPAKVIFEESLYPARIDIRAAKYVDVIHTDAGGLGMTIKTGRHDFWVNGGKNQDGCANTPSVTISTIDNIDPNGSTACNHKRAYEYFIETIDPRCPFTSYKCDNWEKYKNGECLKVQEDNVEDGISVLGYFADDFNTYGNFDSDFFTASGSKSPYCSKVYQYEFYVSSRQQNTEGTITMVLNPGTVEQEELKLTGNNQVPFNKTSNILKGMIITKQNIGKLEGTQLKFIKKDGGFCFVNCPANDVIFNKIKIQYYDIKQTSSYCLAENVLTNGRTKRIQFEKGDCNWIK